MQVRLKVLSGTHAGKEIALKEEKFFVGRGESCHMRPKSESVSRKHCAFVQKDGRVLLADLNSRNGTFVNDVRLESEKAKILHSGDRIRIGQLDFEILIEVGIGGAKKPEVHSVKEAAARVAESTSSNSESRTEQVDIDSWLNDPDVFDRSKLPSHAEPETQLMASGDTTRVQRSSEESAVEESSTVDASFKRPDKKGPIKLPKIHQNQGPSTKNSKDAASNALKKYFGGQ
ncbi:MAG: FHA domain-containing protein [Pirellulaceae bacterium]|nr:FHA domain-containing protein [Pirellulaceae bacterium]